MKISYRMILCDHLTINAICQVMKLTTSCGRDKSNWFLVCNIRTEGRAHNVGSRRAIDGKARHICVLFTLILILIAASV
jgi:hypothetical protein